MDENGRQQQRSNKLSKSLNFLKMTLQLLLPLSVLSLFISHLSILMTLERKYMFLICNGIVALLFKSFTFHETTAVSPTLSETQDHQFLKKTNQGVKRTPPEFKEAKDDQEKGYKDILMEPQDKEEPLEEEDFGQEVEKVEVLIPQESEEDDVDMSTEDLNRRFDEFIRKTKEELRIGARRRLITV